MSTAAAPTIALCAEIDERRPAGVVNVAPIAPPSTARRQVVLRSTGPCTWRPSWTHRSCSSRSVAGQRASLARGLPVASDEGDGARARRALDTARATAVRARVPAETEILEGAPMCRIAEFARDRGARLVVGSRQRTPGRSVSSRVAGEER